MTLSMAMGISLSGLQSQQTRLAATASNVANQSTPAYDRLQTKLGTIGGGGVAASVTPEQTSPVDLAEEMLNLVEAEIGFKANAAVFETGADLWDMLLTIQRD